MLNNSNYSKETATRIPINTVEIHRGDGEFLYAHFPFITSFKGRLIAMWRVTKKHEFEDEDVFMSYSSNFLNWTEPKKLPVSEEIKKQGALAPCGFFVHDDVLNVYFATSEKRAKEGTDGSTEFTLENVHLYCMTTEDGDNFSEPVDMNMPVRWMIAPQSTSTGKVVGAGCFTFPYTDDQSGIYGFKKASYLPEEVYEKYTDAGMNFYAVGKHIGLAVHLLEPTLLDYGNGNLRMLLRSRDNREFVQLENELYTHEIGDNLYATDSTDGVNWSPVYRTEFTNNDSKMSSGRLSDGRFYIVNNPDRLGLRLPLVLSLSEDGENFDKHYIIREDFNNIRNMGRWKQYGCAYPSSIEDDGWLYVIYSVCKEDIHISRISLKDLK